MSDQGWSGKQTLAPGSGENNWILLTIRSINVSKKGREAPELSLITRKINFVDTYSYIIIGVYNVC